MCAPLLQGALAARRQGLFLKGSVAALPQRLTIDRARGAGLAILASRPAGYPRPRFPIARHTPQARSRLTSTPPSIGWWLSSPPAATDAESSSIGVLRDLLSKAVLVPLALAMIPRLSAAPNTLCSKRQK